MITITIEQHTALLVAFDALRDKHVAAAVRRDLQSTEYLNKQYNVIRDLIDNATIEAGDAPTPLWTTDEWGALTPVGKPDFAVEYYTMDKYGPGSALIDMDAVTVPIDAEHLPALIATLQEVQRRIGGEAK